jgi:colicin import membrane protein
VSIESEVNTDQDSFEAALAAALKIQAEAEPQQADSGTDSTGIGEPAQAEQAAVDQAKPADAGTAQQPPAPSAKELERIAALEAREAKLRDAEDRARKLEAREAELSAREAKALKQWEAFAADPVGHIRAMRPELSPAEAAQVAEQLYFHSLGDKAPSEIRQRQEVAKVKTEVSSEVEKLRAELQEERASRARAEQERELAAYRADLRSGVVGLADAPIVASLAQRNPARAEEMLLEIARQAAVESMQAGAAEPVVLTPAQAAAKLEAVLKAQRDELYGPAPAATAAPVTAPQNGQQSPSPTITNRDASEQSRKTAPDPLDDKELRKAALKAAGLDIPVWD